MRRNPIGSNRILRLMDTLDVKRMSPSFSRVALALPPARPCSSAIRMSETQYKPLLELPCIQFNNKQVRNCLLIECLDLGLDEGVLTAKKRLIVGGKPVAPN